MSKTYRESRQRIPHLRLNRLGIWCFRLTMDGQTRQKSLGTKDRALAIMLASKLNWELSMTKRSTEPTVADIIKAFKTEKSGKFDAVFADGTSFKNIKSDDDLRRAKDLMLARIEAIGPIEPHFALSSPQNRPRPTFKGKRFLAATKPYMEEMATDDINNRKTREDKEATYAAFAEQFGDPNMGAIDKAHAVEFKRTQLQIGGALRVNKKIGHLSEFFRWAIGNGEAEANPFDGTRISKKSKLSKKVQSYEPFTQDDLKAIFNPATYPQYATESRPHFKWLPFLLLYSGARPDELAGVRLDQIRQEQGIDFIALKSGKNSNSIRKIPLHRVVRESGFMAYVEQRRKDDPDGQLFPMLKPSKNGYCKNVARRFNENYLAQLRIDEPTKRLYSFRATFITRMTELNVNVAMVMALVGHFEQTAVDLSSPHFKNYQGAKLIGALRDTIDLLDIKLPMAF